MFSRRCQFESRKNRWTLALENKRRHGTPLLDLTVSNPTVAGFEYPEDRITAALASPRSLHYEPDPRGLAEARQAVAAYYAAHGVCVDPDQIILTSGTSEAYAFLMRMLADPTEVFVTPQPSYPLLDLLARQELVGLHTYRLHYDDRWSVDPGSLHAAVTAVSRAVVVVHPNNPTGSFLRATERDLFFELCGAKDLALIADEVFLDYALSPEVVASSLAAAPPVLTFVLSGLSKIAALPQMKLAWIVVCGPDGARQRALETLEIVSDTFLSVSTVVQQAAGELLALRRELQPQILSRLAANLFAARQALAGSAAQALTVEGGWYLVIQLPQTRSEEDWVTALLESADVVLHPGYFFDFEREAYAVASLLTPQTIFQEGFIRLVDFMER